MPYTVQKHDDSLCEYLTGQASGEEGGNCGDTPRRGAYQLTVSIQKDWRLDGMQWRKG